MKRLISQPAGAPRRQAGFTLISVLIATFILGIGLLGIARSTVNITGAETQNQNIASMAAISNGFWGVVQANSTLLTNGLISGVTYTSSAGASGSVPLQSWINQTTAALPGASIQFATITGDANTGAACGAGGLGTNCTVKMTLSWNQVASTGIAASTRSQVFYFEF